MFGGFGGFGGTDNDSSSGSIFGGGSAFGGSSLAEDSSKASPFSGGSFLNANPDSGASADNSSPYLQRGAFMGDDNSLTAVSDDLNVRGSRYGNFSLTDRMRGIESRALLNVDSGEVTLAESYADGALDKRVMNGRYNVTISDVYSDTKLWNAVHGLYADGIIEEGKEKATGLVGLNAGEVEELKVGMAEGGIAVAGAGMAISGLNKGSGFAGVNGSNPFEAKKQELGSGASLGGGNSNIPQANGMPGMNKNTGSVNPDDLDPMKNGLMGSYQAKKQLEMEAKAEEEKECGLTENCDDKKEDTNADSYLKKKGESKNELSISESKGGKDILGASIPKEEFLERQKQKSNKDIIEALAMGGVAQNWVNADLTKRESVFVEEVKELDATNSNFMKFLTESKASRRKKKQLAILNNEELEDELPFQTSSKGLYDVEIKTQSSDDVLKEKLIAELKLLSLEGVRDVLNELKNQEEKDYQTTVKISIIEEYYKQRLVEEL